MGWNPIAHFQAGITLKVLRVWLKDSDLLDEQGHLKPDATLKKFGSDLWLNHARTGLRFNLQRVAEMSIRLGPVTLNGANAMRFAAMARTKNGYLCVRPPSFTFSGKYFPAYIYLSPDGTPRSAVWGWCGKGGLDGYSIRRNLSLKN